MARNNYIFIVLIKIYMGSLTQTSYAQVKIIWVLITSSIVQIITNVKTRMRWKNCC